MASTETIQLEAFQTPLHGSRILLHGPFPDHQFPPILSWVQRLREPFKKKVLLTRSTAVVRPALPLTYDAIFQVTETADYQLAFQYLTYAAKPTLVVLEDVPVVPDGFWVKLPRTVTVIHLVEKAPFQIRPYDAIFFAPIEDTHSVLGESAFKILQSVYKASYSSQEHKEIVSELRVAGAGIAWTNVDESRQGGAIYWYDRADAHANGDQLTNQQMADILQWVASLLDAKS